MKNKEMLPQFDNKNMIFARQNNNEITDSTFNLWKSELQKSLPEFWESMI
jgi:hypothetical protein